MTPPSWAPTTPAPAISGPAPTTAPRQPSRARSILASALGLLPLLVFAASLAIVYVAVTGGHMHDTVPFHLGSMALRVALAAAGLAAAVWAWRSGEPRGAVGVALGITTLSLMSGVLAAIQLAAGLAGR